MMTVLTYFFISLLAVTTVQLSWGQTIDREPAGKIILTQGQSQNLLCRSGEAFDYCRFEIPGEGVKVLRKDKPSLDQNFQYYGEGLDKGQCGVTILKVSERNHGRVVCSGSVASGVEISSSFELEVALSPAAPELELSRPRTPDGSFEADTELVARCIVRDGRPAPGIKWFLNNEPIYEGLQQLTTIETNQQEQQTSNIPPLYTVHQELHKIVRAEDNGKFLVCQSEHQADREPKYSKHQLKISYRPQPLPEVNVYGLFLDRTNTINVTIYANPRPQVEWSIGGDVISQGNQNGRFAASEPMELGNGYYNVTLRIGALTLEDTTKIYSLKASNALGTQDYRVRISSSETPASSGLDIGAIIGIIVAIAIVLIIVLMVLFARLTGRWCFAGKSPKSPKSETSDTESAVVKQSKSKRLPTFSALFKKRNEKFNKDSKKDSSNGDQNEDEQKLAENLGGNGGDGMASDQSKDGDNNDNQLKEDKQLVYAELVLKPAEDKPSPPKKSTEYAEIVYVQKQATNPTAKDIK